MQPFYRSDAQDASRQLDQIGQESEGGVAGVDESPSQVQNDAWI